VVDYENLGDYRLASTTQKIGKVIFAESVELVDQVKKVDLEKERDH